MSIQSNLTVIYWSEVRTSFFDHRPFIIAATNEGLCNILWPEQPLLQLQKWANQKMEAVLLVEDGQATLPYVQELQEYFHGKRKAFTVPLDLYGTSFQLEVWKELQKIAFGQTVSYKEVARKIGNPKAARAVGTAVKNNPVPYIIPCHRVIGKNKTLTGFGGGLEAKKKLLQLEGVRL